MKNDVEECCFCRRRSNPVNICTPCLEKFEQLFSDSSDVKLKPACHFCVRFPEILPLPGSPLMKVMEGRFGISICKACITLWLARRRSGYVGKVLQFPKPKTETES
jgi:hypothetical protein